VSFGYWSKPKVERIQPPIVQGKLSVLNFNDPIVATIDNTNASTLRRLIDGRLYRPDAPCFSINDSNLTIRPPAGYWLPGKHLIQFRKGKEEVCDEICFFAEWRANFQSAEKYLPIIDPQKRKHGTVSVDSSLGALVLDQVIVDGKNASYVETENFTDQFTNYQIGIRLQLIEYRGGCFQATLPGNLSIQVADGDISTVTVKVDELYVDKKFIPCQEQQKDAWKGNIKDVESKEIWLWIIREGDFLGIYQGLNNRIPILEHRFRMGSLAVADTHNLTLRSFGAKINVSEVIVRPLGINE